MILTLLAFVFGYLCGSIPFGLILTALSGAGDLRAIGSGNIGATNVLRTGRKDLAAATLLLDALKAAFPVLVVSFVASRRLSPMDVWPPAPVLAAAFGAFVGHIFPVWLGFRGGKGVASFLGALLAVSWPAGLVFMGLWLIVAFIARYSSLAALCASALTPVVLYFFGQFGAAIVFAAMAVLIFYKHAANIGRLRAGTESRIGKA
ncbi:glycerol-3-phosphate 1-O-acyltransferase PlsY [Methylocella sp.]|uniref:glycerol-3-phosphate 1-O-acyltransferase PlsY n=1 Tax=Methylocella sp. TaxID=1978226 RepID=UPI003783EE8E